MRLDFNVLWVEDQPDRVDAQIKGIRRQMEGEGFNFNPTICRSPEELQEQIADDVFADEVDLILVDWDLGSKVKGQDVIEVVREKVQYKDVVFYSARTDAPTLRRLAFEKGIEGIYCASREDLVEEVLGVFESLVKKVLDLDHARGIVMGATCDIDNMVNECLVAMHELLDEAGQQGMLEQALERINKRIEESASKVAELKKAPSMAALFEAHMIFTANDRLRILSGLLKTAFRDHVSTRQSVVTYMNTVVPHRNKLGHLVLVPGGKPQSVATSEGREISVEELRELRRMILSIRAEFIDLMLALKEAVAARSS